MNELDVKYKKAITKRHDSGYLVARNLGSDTVDTLLPPPSPHFVVYTN
jgi:hypothetical protein